MEALQLPALPERDRAPDSALSSLYAAVEALAGAVESGQSVQACAAAAREVELHARRIAEQHERALLMPRSFAPMLGDQPALRLRVLLVEEGEDEIALLQQILEPWFDVLVARTLKEAMEVLNQTPPDVVLADLNLPDDCGLSLLRLVSSSDESVRIPTIVVSGEAEVQAKVTAFESGAFDFITRPVAPEELVARIRNALAHAQLIRHERAMGGRDDLTGLSNRRAFRTFLDGAVRRAREQHVPLALVLVDQDRLKHINDSWGHLAGDEALRTLSHALASSTRGTDCAARVGGDEFALVIPGCDREGAERLLARVEEMLRRSPLALPDGTEIFVEASFGLACLDEDGPDDSMDRLVRRADGELYRCKRERREAIRG